MDQGAWTRTQRMLAMNKVAIRFLTLPPNQTTAMLSFGKAWGIPVGMMMVHMEAARGVRLDPRQEVILTNLWLKGARRSNVVLLHENRWKQGLLLRLVIPLVDHFVWLKKRLELRMLWAWALGRFRL